MNVDWQKVQESLEYLQEVCHGLASNWWIDLKTGEDLRKAPRIVPEKIALIHSEASEALEGYRKGLQDDHLPHHPMITVELADVLIRTFDLAGAMKYNVPLAFAEKLKYNQERADHKLFNRIADGGKKC